ncbi:hypothetical protein FRB99_000618 [Tulasnella sp. 403]|nr:hypothetical protein FRB99_000618 [Tulasnella sp. 403]
MPKHNSLPAGLNALGLAPLSRDVVQNVNPDLIMPESVPDPGYGLELKFLDSYNTCLERLTPHFDHMREYFVRHQGWIPERHIVALETLHNDWLATVSKTRKKGFWQYELLTQKGHSLASEYWRQLKALKWQLSQLATTRAIQGLKAHREQWQDQARRVREHTMISRPADQPGPSRRVTPRANDDDFPSPLSTQDLDVSSKIQGLDLDLPRNQ